MIKFAGDKSEGITIAENKAWHCELNEKSVPLCLVIEVIDMYEATGEKEFEQYPYLVSIGIMANKPHKSFYEGEGRPNKLDLIYDCNGYMGSIPVDRKFIQTDALNHNITGKLNIKDACLVTVKCDFGTIAAQEGKGSSFIYPQFKTDEAACKYAQELVKLYGNTLMTLVGFTLDQPINLAGDSGWSQIETMVNGK